MSPENKQAFIAQIPGFLAPSQAAGVCKFHAAPLLLDPQGMRIYVLLPWKQPPTLSETLSAVPTPNLYFPLLGVL